MTHTELANHLNKLAAVVSLPSLSTKRNKPILEAVEKLMNSFLKYQAHLQQDNENHARQASEARRATEEQTNWSSTKPTNEDTTLQYICETNHMKESYSALDSHLSAADCYEFVDLSTFAPANHVKRRQYIKDLRVSVPIVLMRIAYGGSLGTLNFVWKTDDRHSEAERVLRNAAIVHDVKSSLPKYTSRAVRREFVQRYHQQVKVPKSLMRQLFDELTGSENAPDNADTAKSDQQAREFLLNSDDPSIILDYRVKNGKTGTNFEAFYTEVENYFEEQVLQVNERRQGTELYLPLAISVEDLRKQVSKRLPAGTPVPSAESLRLQFHPSNAHVKVAERYSGRFNVKFRIQTRLARLHHADAGYVGTQYQYLKEFAVLHRNVTNFVCLDDKAVVPIGEPGVPLSTGVRPHNRVIAPIDGQGPVAADHDFHVSGLVPSVAFVVNIPQNCSDSFFQGRTFVTTKDKVFQPSSPLRHSTELTTVLSSLDEPGEGTASDDLEQKSILLIFTDGGPDHRVTFETVKLSLLSLFMELDLDMLVALRTAPHNSWQNPAERVMSVLNLALQHVALQREPMPEAFEAKMKNKSSMAAVRNTAELINGFQEAYLASVSGVIDLINSRFERMSIKDIPIKTFKAAAPEDIENSLSVVRQVANCHGITSKSKTKDIRACKDLQNFMRQHTKSTNYAFQVKKCRDPDCTYCVNNPVRMDAEKFADVHFLPDPVPEESGGTYKPFTQVFTSKISLLKHYFSW